MKIDYTYEDARKIESVYFALPERPTTKRGREVRAAFLQALNLCGVVYVRWQRGEMDAFRVFAKDGGDFPSKQKEEYNTIKKASEK